MTIYFDHNATTPLHPAVTDAAEALAADGWAVDKAAIDREGRTADGIDRFVRVLGGLAGSVASAVPGRISASVLTG